MPGEEGFVASFAVCARSGALSMGVIETGGYENIIAELPKMTLNELAPGSLGSDLVLGLPAPGTGRA